MFLWFFSFVRALSLSVLLILEMEKLYLRMVPALLFCQKDIIEDVED